ncbi:hypothetical protein SUGI_0197980 [Cryptomeria japonica]|uniref:transcription factor bHLH129 n=1 Tax=Cryptomeria japonica TaxID=3369 RepID=UPI002408CB6B|nr:transcription factor bHLH129 [Cryptomeria japonica]GLJ12797.1 hypothetical protein SUGI_0197980 [Cryptomeria japonica]
MSPENWQIKPVSALHTAHMISEYSGMALNNLVMQSDSAFSGNSIVAGIRSDFNGAAGSNYLSTLISNIHSADPTQKQDMQHLANPYLQHHDNNYSSNQVFHIDSSEQSQGSVDCFSNSQIYPFDGPLFQSLICSNGEALELSSPSQSTGLVNMKDAAGVEAQLKTPVDHMPRHLYNYSDDFACENMLAQDPGMAIGFNSQNVLAWPSQSSINTDEKSCGQIHYTNSSVPNQQLQLPLKRSCTINIEDDIQPCTKKMISWSSPGSSCNSVQSKSPKLKSARARQGSAMDPQSVAARLRRERISERLKILQDLVPNGSKFDLVTMLEKAINYVKFLQLQVKVLTTDEYWPKKDNSTAAIVKMQDVIQEIASTRSLAEIEGMISMEKKNKNLETN